MLLVPSVLLPLYRVGLLTSGTHRGTAGMKARRQEMVIPILIFLKLLADLLLKVSGNFRDRRRSRLTRTKLLMEEQRSTSSMVVIT